MDIIRIQLLAEDILTRFKGTQPGHCARVDFLATTEAMAICQYIISQQAKQKISAYILTKQDELAHNSPIFITVDKAIELRNRKQEKLCLFVPADLVDAAYSSLANSFAVIDGRELHTRVLRRVINQLPEKVEQFVRATFAQLRGSSRANDDQKLDFAIAIRKRAEDMEMHLAGLELWRVGLIADTSVGALANGIANPDLERKLEHNRSCTIALARPTKIDATARERIQNLKVNAETAAKLTAFFRGKSMNDIHSWSRQLAAQPEVLTLDTWVFPETEASDIREVLIKPFVNSAGMVEKYTHLIQPDGAKGSLIARCAPKEKLVVRWECEPKQPQNLGGWRVAIVPSDGEIEYEGNIELPERDLPTQRRNTTINMNIEFDEPPDFAVRVRVMPLNADGTVIVDPTGQEVYGESNEFFLSNTIEEVKQASHRESKFVVSNLMYGHLEYAIEANVSAMTEAEPQWSSKDLEYFSVKLNDRRMLQVGVSATLLQLERQNLADSRKGGSYTLIVDDIHTVDVANIIHQPLLTSSDDDWNAFWKTRELFFSRLRKASYRDVIEVAEWTPELTGAALRYAQAYRELIEDLLENQVSANKLREALSIDSILIQITGRNNTTEEAIVILPTHPLRVAWLVNYTQLLQAWETQLLAMPLRNRQHNLDLQALRLLTPINVPAFAYHIGTQTAFTFFQNLRFFYGVALPVGVPDPHRRYGDITTLFGMSVEQGTAGDTHPEQLAAHLKNFLELHPYTNTLVTTLVNPDRGDFFAEALKQLMPGHRLDEDNEEQAKIPTFQITAYTDSKHKSTLQALEQVRQLGAQQRYKQDTDHFLPALATTLRPIERLAKSSLPEAHIAVVTDLTQPAIKAITTTDQDTNKTASFSLYGLVSRFISQITVESEQILWQHKIVTEGVRKPEAHPASSRFSDLLIELHSLLLSAGGYLLSGSTGTQPILEVTLTQEQRKLLENLHRSTNWVVTLDRFFSLDYYDSPHEPSLNTLAQKYVLDYSPEFTDGLGHRMMVTTAWHEEIQSLLSQAMNDLGFARVDQSVSHLLHHLKTISGRLALQALESSTTAAAAVGLGVVTAWLEKKGRLKQAVLIPVDTYPRLFTLNGSGKPTAGERRCDLVLISLKRNIVDATFIEVKWRRGQVPFEELSKDMVLQMKNSALIMRNRFFNETRVDGALQRSYLANVLRFYFERSRRYRLFDQEAETTFLEHVSRLEKTGLEFRSNYEGYIVSLEGEERRPFPIDDAKITVLTAKDFEQGTEFASRIYTPLDNVDTLSDEPLVEERANNEEDEENIVEATDAHDEQLAVLTPALRAGSEYSYDIAPASQAQVSTQTPALERTSSQPIQSSEEQAAPDDTVIIPLGSAAGTAVDWFPAINGSPHIFILGIPGQGKSWTVTRILTELGRQQVPSLVLDFHGQFADPHEPFVQAVHPTMLDAAKGLPFSPFECTQEAGSGGWLANSYAIAEIFGHVAGLGDMQRDVVFSAIRDAYKAHGFSDDADLPTSELTYPTLAEVLQRIENLAQVRHVSNVAARCRPLLEMNLFRPVEHTPDLLSLVRSGLVIDLHNLYIDAAQQAAGAFVLRKIYKDMFSWGYAKRIRLAIVLDEAHRLAKDVTLPKIMREGRKFGIAVIVASQGMADFHPDVLATAGTKVIFRMNYPDSKKVSGFIRGLPGQDLAARIEQLTVGSAYVQTPDMPFGSVVKMYPLK
ncbi:ATP-binding protein [Ktedonobacter racemifer]|uniref:Helicase HerA central domain-containing protein n=1 Tax=Ktedonobacter racemifer DSM 44963 TaxID=485913 RepID=D6U8L3_KTERA|nr:ATP-binding protein [Ktedonobacter racemifer]EFH80224.1 conserved hypothetical protein [Ktedonobacter racemifer DSM 44963]